VDLADNIWAEELVSHLLMVDTKKKANTYGVSV
jgi:hypothetical protein